MSESQEPPAKRPKYNLRSHLKSENKQQLFETISTTELVDLNDDCLDKIFGYVDVIELCSVTQVCKRFQHLASLYFKRKYNKLDFSTLFTNRSVSHQGAGNILRNFGQMIEAMSIPRLAFHYHDTNGNVEEALLKDIGEYCCETLRTLRLKDFCFTSHSVELLNMLSNSLEHLSLVGCVVDVDCVFILSNFSSLKVLEITDTFDCYALMDTFPALVVLRLKRVSINILILKHFIVAHKQLKMLKISSCKGISSDVVSCIGKYMKNLTKLFFDGIRITSESKQQIRNSILHLSELKNLQTFTWSAGPVSIGNVLAKMVSNKVALRQLLIGSIFLDDETIEAIGKMTNLEYLSFNRTKGLKDQHLIRITNEVKQLKQLCIEAKTHLDINSNILKDVLSRANQLTILKIYLEKFHLGLTLYNDILDIVKKRQNGVKLTIKLKNHTTDVHDLIAQQTIQMNENWLIIN